MRANACFLCDTELPLLTHTPAIRQEEALKPHFELSKALIRVEYKQGISYKLERKYISLSLQARKADARWAMAGQELVLFAIFSFLPMLFCMQIITFTFHFHALEKEVATHSMFLPGESKGRRSLVGCHLWSCTESDTTEAT